MDDAGRLVIVERAWNADRQLYDRMVWTAVQLRRIGQAVKEDDRAFLGASEQAMCRALETARTKQRG